MIALIRFCFALHNFTSPTAINLILSLIIAMVGFCFLNLFIVLSLTLFSFCFFRSYLMISFIQTTSPTPQLQLQHPLHPPLLLLRPVVVVAPYCHPAGHHRLLRSTIITTIKTIATIILITLPANIPRVAAVVVQVVASPSVSVD